MARRSPLQPVVDFLRSSFDELGKVVWPSREQSIRYTVIVVVSVVVVTGIIASLDYGLSKGLEQLIVWSQRV